MSNYHILSADQNGNSFSVVFHIPIPSILNQAEINYRSAVVEWQGGAEHISSNVPFIEGAELTQIQAGELYEVFERFNSNPNQTLAEKRDALDARFAVLTEEWQSILSDVLSYWGYSRDVAA